MRIGELQWVLRQSGVLGEGGGEPSPAELADALWLAALRRAGRSVPPVADDVPPSGDALAEIDDFSGVEEPAWEHPPEPLPPPPVPEPDPTPLPDEPPDVQVYATLPARGGPSPGVLVSAAVRPQLPETLPLARAMRPLRQRVPSATRRVLDEEGTADLRAEQQLWLPALIPDREPAFDLALVLDDSESMALWGEKAREFWLLCERIGAFRDVRPWRLGVGGAGRRARPVVRGLSRSSGARDERELIDPSGRRLILVVTDGVHPWWGSSGPLRPVLARWALASPLAIVQPFPQRLWDRSPLRPVMEQFRPGWPGNGPTIRRAGNGSGRGQGGPGSVAVPVLELSPAAMRRWAGIISGTSGLTPLPAAILPCASTPEQEPPSHLRAAIGEGQPDPAQLVKEFRASVSPAAYQLAGYLSAAPLALPVMRLVQESMMPETGPSELAEVFLSGLLRRSAEARPTADAEGALYVFPAGVRDVLQSTLTKSEALTVRDQVGSYLIGGPRGGRSFPVNLGSHSAGDDVTEAFGRISGLLLERLGGPYANALRQTARPEELVQLEEPVQEVRKSRDPMGWTAYGPGLPKIYQPVLFVGLGGTGCDIGAELERQLRIAICGPDGNRYRTGESGRRAMLPYQLPSCVQFVYADLDAASLDRMPTRVVPGPEHFQAVPATARYVASLPPNMLSYPELAMRLRLRAEQATKGWLPPATRDEPKVSPLFRGAGQLPTIGRAALFGTLLDGLAPAVRDISVAAERLSSSGADLFALGGRPPRGIDVFVAFSVAGGTGAGIFYDYVHMIADTLSRFSAMQVRIYPLVLMPSAFPEGLGGGRGAELNAGRALRDLFRLVDQQNGADAGLALRGASDPGPDAPEDAVVSYPDGTGLVMRPGTMQTGFVFSLPSGAAREDMHRSVVSLVLSLVGMDQSQDDRTWDRPQSFADSFVSEAPDRLVSAENGIGGRGVSTALVASLTVPADELAGIVGARLLREAIEQLTMVDGKLESNRVYLEEFFVRAGIHPVLPRQGAEFTEPDPARGARDIAAALNDRRTSMQIGIEALRTRLGREIPRLVAAFNPSGAAHDLLGKMDVFRLQRVVDGHPNLTESVEQAGVRGLLQLRRAAPGPPEEGWGPTPPALPELRDWLMRRTQWNDAPVVAARNQQNAWYAWQTRVVWASIWDTHILLWRPPLDLLERDLTGLTRALVAFARADAGDFARRSDDLYRRRVGLSYLLPFGGGQMEQFYQQVLRRLRDQMVRDRSIEINSREADVVQALAGPDIWQKAFRISVEDSPEQAVSFLRGTVKTEVMRFLRAATPGEQPILPRMHDLLADAAGHGPGSGTGVDQDYLDGFQGKLAGLLPANFTPQGRGPMRVLITYPADFSSEVVEEYLKSAVNLPTGPRVTLDFRPTQTESLSIVLFRTAMGITEVDEVRDVLRKWASAQPIRCRPTYCAGGSGPAMTSATWSPASMTEWRSCTGSCARCGTAGPPSSAPSSHPSGSTSASTAA